MPTKNVLQQNAAILYRVVSTPIAAALPSSSRIATSPVPNFVRRIAQLNPIAANINSRKK
jgi:hypothetical protein